MGRGAYHAAIDQFVAVFIRIHHAEANGGNLCVFERYTGGSREGEIVLAQVSGQDDDYLCRYTIKKYHSEKIVSDDSWVHNRIELLPINTDGYSPVVLDDTENYRMLGVLRYVISD